MRVVISLTTVPSRVAHLNGILDSLRAQTYSVDRIYLNLPWRSRRENRKYPRIPDHVDLTKVTVNRCSDYGPITKLYPVLRRERSPDTVIITVDDDNNYCPERVETLVKYCKKYPDSAIGGSGFVVGTWYRFFGMVLNPVKPTPVNVIEGWSACAYRRKFFQDDLIDYGDAPPGAFYHDDLWISGYLSLRNIPRLVCPGRAADLGDLPGALSGELMCVPRFISTAVYLKSKGAFDEPTGEQFPFLSNFVFAIIVILLVLIWLIYRLVVDGYSC